MIYVVFDIEADGLIETATKIHCISIQEFRDGVKRKFTLVDYKEMTDYLLSLGEESYLIGHNIIRYDIPMIEKFLGIKPPSRKIDTLGLSWYLYPNRKEHGLESWGVDFGVEKPKIEDWSNQRLEDYIFRCEQDTEINLLLWDSQKNYLMELYGSIDAALRLIRYLSFKLECAREQEEVKWKVDVDKCILNLNKLREEQQKKLDTLTVIMPKVIEYKIVSRPKVCFKKDGTVSEHGKKWFALLQSENLPEYHNTALKLVSGEKMGNPGSHEQVKDWLYSLGWIPDHYKHVKNKKTGEVKKVPQIGNQDGTDISDSVKLLYEKVPELESLAGLYVINHRIGILEGFLENRDENDFLKAQIKGFTNTLRFQHTTIVNLPTIPKPYWEEVRGCLIAPEGFELCGSDMSSLEDNTKQHYMYYFDPKYVLQMRTPGFDPHIDIAVRAKGISYDEGEFFKWYSKKKEGKAYNYTPTDEFTPIENHVLDKEYVFEELLNLSDEVQTSIVKTIKPLRLKFKKGNFASVYGAGVVKLAITMGISHSESKKFHVAYWIRNKSVKDVSDACIVRSVGGQKWLHNPVSGFWYSLREEKDKFSTLNQGTGVYCFDTWVNNVVKHRTQLMKFCGQFHDEVIILVPKGHRESTTEVLQLAIQETNKMVQLNVPLGISVDFGDNYAAIH